MAKAPTGTIQSIQALQDQLAEIQNQLALEEEARKTRLGELIDTADMMHMNEAYILAALIDFKMKSEAGQKQVVETHLQKIPARFRKGMEKVPSTVSENSSSSGEIS